MIHSDRTFCAKPIDTDEDLAEVMSNHEWALCQTFEHDGFLYLNDGSSEKSPEYSVVRVDSIDGLTVTGREVGRINPFRMDVSKVLKFIQDMKSGIWSQDSSIKLKVEPYWHHGCELCEFRED